MLDQIADFLFYASRVLAVVAAAAGILALIYNVCVNHGMPRIGGKIGRRRPGAPAVPDGFRRVDCREIVRFVAPAEATGHADLRSYARNAVERRPGLIHVYRVAGLRTRIEIAAEPPDYERIAPAEVLALLRELPDPRLIHRLHLSDHASILDPWVRQTTGLDFFSFGHATLGDLVVLYRPDRRLGPEIGLTLLHEWLHLVAFKSARAMKRFKRAGQIEPAPPLPPVADVPREPLGRLYETWARFGETLLGYDESASRQAALAAPVHAVILWRCVERLMRKTPRRLASTRRAEFEARAAFIRLEVLPKARAARAQRRWWSRWRAPSATPTSP